MASDLVVRSLDFAGADDVADRLMPANPAALSKAMEGLPREAQSIVHALMQQVQQLTAQAQQLDLDKKYKGHIELGWMHTELEKERMKLQGQSESNATKREDTHVRATTARMWRKSPPQGRFNTHARAGHEARRAETDALRAAEQAKRNRSKRCQM